MFWYSGLARICSRVSASGACVRMRSSQLCLVSSIAAHSSPLGWAAAPVNTSSGMRTSSFPIPFRPSASARRRAGSTVSTSTRPPCSTTAVAASAAAVVVLPTPPGPHAMTMSLAEISWPTVLASGDVSRRHSPSSSPSAWATWRVVRAPKLRGEEVGQEEDGQVLGQPGLEPLQVGRACPPHGDGEAGRLEHGRHGAHRPAPTACARPPAGAAARRSPPRARPKSSGRTRLTTTADMRTVVSSRTRCSSSRVSLTGISSGVHTATRPVWRGSERMSSIQSVWLRISPTLTRSLMACGAASWPMMCPAGRARPPRPGRSGTRVPPSRACRP